MRIAHHAKQGKPFSRLFRTLTWSNTLDLAISAVLQNKGAKTPGIDGKTRSDYATWDARLTLRRQLIQKLRRGTYRPLPVKRLWIPKAHKPKELRPLGIPTIVDRTVQEAVRSVLEPMYEQRFCPHSYGFRPFRCTHHAIERIRALIDMGYEWVVEGDIRGFFDNVDHDILLSLLRRDIQDNRLLGLIHTMLKAGVMDKDQVTESEWGTPQGGILSPLLANVYLHELDLFIANKYERLSEYQRKRQPHRLFAVRYADDFVLLVRESRQYAEALKEEVSSFLRDALHLELSEEKTLITHVDDGFDFLGFTVRRVRHHGRKGVLSTPSKKTQERFRLRVRELTESIVQSRLSWILALNEYLSGWAEYYRHGNSKRAFRKLDNWTWWRIGRMLRRRHQGARDSPGFWETCSLYLKPYRLDVQHAHYRRRRARNFGEWVDERHREALIVDQLSFYPIRYVNKHSQANAFTHDGRQKLEDDRKLVRLLNLWDRIHQTAGTELEPSLTHQLAEFLRLHRGLCPRCGQRFNQRDFKHLLNELAVPLSHDNLRWLPVTCQTCARK